MATPVMVVQIAFGSVPLTKNASAAWVDVSASVDVSDGIEHQIRRGRNHERDEFEAGTAIVVLRNTNRIFDPDNSTAPAPYYGNLEPMTKIRIGASWSGTTYWLFVGYIESFTPEYPGGNVSNCTLECVDAFKFYGMVDVHTSGNRAQEYSNNRISAALTAIGWPPEDSAIMTGDVIMQEMQLDDSALGIIQQTTQAERGQFYIDREGYATFEARTFRDGVTSSGIWGGAADGSELPYSDVSFRFDDSQIWNQVYATRIGGKQQHAYNTTSQTEYFVRTLHMAGLPWVDDTAAWTAALHMVARYAVPHTRPERMVIDPGVRNTWTSVLPRDISDRVTIKRPTLIDTDVFTLDGYIEAIDWHITKGMWIVTWQLSPVFSPGSADGALVTTDSWLVPTLTPTWVNYGAPTADAGYRKEGDTVRLRGVVKNGAIPSTIFTLPVGYRPPSSEQFTVVSADHYATVNVSAAGAVVAQSTVSAAWVNLSAIQFRVI